MTDYSQLSDFEINKRVAEIVYSIEVVADDFYVKDIPFAYHRDEQVFIFIDEPLSGAWRSYNPCNNPADAWPIIVENMISVDQHANGSYARVWGYSESGIVETESLRSNILRAAMIVFLMMQEKSK